jgi:hypothetical protein
MTKGQRGCRDNAPAERVLIRVQDEVPQRDFVLRKARADLAPVLLDQGG